jgi:hypothetical protein
VHPVDVAIHFPSVLQRPFRHILCNACAKVANDKSLFIILPDRLAKKFFQVREVALRGVALSQKCSSNGGSTRTSYRSRSAVMYASSIARVPACQEPTAFQAQCPQTRVTPVVHIEWQIRRKITCTYCCRFVQAYSIQRRWSQRVNG